MPPTLWTDHHKNALCERGFTVVGPLLTAAECSEMIAFYDQDHFRKRVVMQRHAYGRGEYQYFRYPLPDRVAELRTLWYEPLAEVANLWHEQLRIDTRFPNTHAEFLATCRASGQDKATPLLLRYGPDDFNCLHQDLYGENVFPLQMAFLLNQPGESFEGGEFVLVEQRPRRQSRAEVVALTQGQAVIFAVNHFPGKGTRGYHRVKMRHGVSRLTRGARHCLGIIFHDART